MKMKSRFLTVLPAAAASLLFTIPAPAQLNQQNPAGSRPNQLRRPAAKNYIAELKQITDALALEYKARIVLDPAIIVLTKPSPPMEGVALSGALNALTSQLKKVAWKRVYLTQNNGAIVPPAEK